MQKEKNLPEPLTTFSEIEALLHRREDLFLGTLAVSLLEGETHIGWEKIEEFDLSGETIKYSADPNGKTLFTGEHTCDTVSPILYKALGDLLQTTHFSVQLVDTSTDFSAENWGNLGYFPQASYHQLVQITDMDTDQKLYVDGSYGQINHHYAGKIVCIPEDKLHSFYRDSEHGISINVLSQINAAREISHAYLRISQSQFNRLASMVAA